MQSFAHVIIAREKHPTIQAKFGNPMVSAFKSIAKLKFGNRIPSRIDSLKIVRVIYRIRQPRISIPGIPALRRSNLEIQKYPMPKQNFYAVQHGRETGVYLTWSANRLLQANPIEFKFLAGANVKNKSNNFLELCSRSLAPQKKQRPSSRVLRR